MKKRMLQLLSLLLLFCMAGSLFACKKEGPSPKEANLIEDGIKRSELRYVENPYFKDGKIYYTLVNNKNEKTTVSEAPPDVEKWDGEKWVISYLTNKEDGIYWKVKAYSKTTLSFSVDCSPQGAAGKYRLSFGYKGRTQDENGTLYYVYDPERTYTVFYVTIPEEGEYTATPIPSRLELAASISGDKDSNFKLQITLKNLGDKPYTFQTRKPELELYTKGEKSNFFEDVSHYQYEPLEEITVAPGESATCTYTICARDVYGGENLPVVSVKGGRYRVAVWGSFEGGKENQSPYAYFDFSAE